MSVVTREILEGKSFDNEVIIPNEMKPIEKMIKRNGPKKFVATAGKQKTLSFFYS
jgi:hypothetical protein